MSFTALSRLLLEGRPPGHPVTPDRTWDEFSAAAAWAANRAAGGRRWVLACPGAWEFAAGLLGLLQAGCTVVLPPNFQPGTLAGLEADGILDGTGLASPRAGALAGSLEFWTSGSTGEPKAALRSLAQAELEAAMLERTFGHLMPSGPVVGTVPHHHIYGCLFRLLWPLSAGRPFLAEPAGDPAAFLRALAHPDPVALVSSPAHLSRLPRLLDLDAVPAPGVIFSSGGPLAAADAALWRHRVLEIYGSTETGGIAWRNQGADPASAAWTPCDDVAVSFQAGALVVDSFRAGPLPVRMEDAAEPEGGRFRLLGRLDRIVKLAEKRISLPELERALEAHPWVARAAVAALDGDHLGAAVVLGPAAPAEREILVRTLKEHLAQRFEGVALPKRWRFPQELPFDSRGKLTPQGLASPAMRRSRAAHA